MLATLTLRIVPSVVVSRTASDMEGFCLINFPKGPVTKDSLKKDIIITLGGLVAERMIFGHEFTSTGVYCDIEEASSLANRAVRRYGMGSDPIHLAVGTQNEDAFTISQKYNAEAVSLVKECEHEAEAILQRNKLLLLKIADYLTTHSRMEEQMIAEFVCEFSVENWVQTAGFIKKDEYYRFNTVLQQNLAELEKLNFPLAVEKMVATSAETSS